MTRIKRSRRSLYQGHGTAFSETSVLYDSPEVVGVLPDQNELEATVDELLLSGFDRQQISVLASWPARSDSISGAIDIPAAGEWEDDPRTRFGSLIFSASRTEFGAATVGIPVYVASIGGYAAVVASGGSLALALAAILLVGTTGATPVGFLARTIARPHSDAIAAQIGQGGLLLWAQVKRLGQVATAIQALNGHRARHVHVHLLERGWEIEPGRPECIRRTVGA
ncbi:hypothetical protein [Mesorhizobium mediterraneum]|uniref:hypothetical protein n=1 Tax=Mesorhizobium mediterraneum TaxID=43617 RepID=UPI0017846B96|nr:hypothetical protein [Mesorhizobium mediterraneum]